MFVRMHDEQVETAAFEYFKGIVFKPLEMGEKSWIAGGCLREWMLEKRLNKSVDIDVWCADDAERQRLDEAAKKAGWTEKKSSPTSSNWKSKSGHWVQFIRGHYFPTPEETIGRFDFTVCAISLSANGHMLLHESTLLDMTLKRLMLMDLDFPLSTLRRAFKYRDKGFSICNEELETLMDACCVAWFKKRKEEMEAKERAAAEGGDPAADVSVQSRYPYFFSNHSAPTLAIFNPLNPAHATRIRMI